MLVTTNNITSCFVNRVCETPDKMYRHRRLQILPSHREKLIQELQVYLQNAHAHALNHFKELIDIDLDPLQEGSTITVRYPKDLHINILKGYFGEALAGLTAEYFSPMDENDWTVPIFLFKFHNVVFERLELFIQAGVPLSDLPGRTGDDCIAFRFDSNGFIFRSLYCESKCLTKHHNEKVTDAFTKVNKGSLSCLHQMIPALRERNNPQDHQYVLALLRLKKKKLPETDQYNMICYVCIPPLDKEINTRYSWISKDAPHVVYTSSKRLETVEIHIPDLDSFVRCSYDV